MEIRIACYELAGADKHPHNMTLWQWNMLNLFLDTASKDHVLALCDEEKMLSFAPLEARNDAAIAPAIEAALKAHGLQYEDLDRLACVIGPGGFSSLRIGATAINTIAFALDLPSVGIHLSDLWKARVLFERVRNRRTSREVPPTRNFLWLHSTRRTQIFVKGFGADGTITPTALFDLDDAAKLQGAYVGELIPEHQTLLRRCTQVKDVTPLEEMLPAFLNTPHYRKQQLTPWYGREG